MKNFLIALAALFGCFVVAVLLEFAINTNFGMGFKGGKNGMVATWRNYDDPGLAGLQVSIGPEVIILDVRDKNTSKRIQEKGHWASHNFYCDSHLDVPAEVVVARELKSEDLELDLGRFMPSHPGKIVCVKVFRICESYPYPTNVPGRVVTYPPPKGLIRPGMLECDLQMLPWHADRVDGAPIVITVDLNALSDGKKNRNYFRSDNHNEAYPSMVYSYHSDRADAPKLLVTVYHGRVIQVVGGAEETNDVPYRFPSASDRDAPQQQENSAGSWVSWLFDLLFKK